MAHMLQNPEVKSLEQIFDRRTQYQIPLFQRDYAWGEEEVDDLFADLLRLHTTGDEHFFGTIVISPSAPGAAIGSGENVKFVIDGQQRLTSSILLLAAIRHHLYELTDLDGQIHRRVGDIDDYLFIGRDEDVPGQKPRVSANRVNQVFLKAVLTHQAQSGAEVRAEYARLTRDQRNRAKKLYMAYLKHRKNVADYIARQLDIALDGDDDSIRSHVTNAEDATNTAARLWDLASSFIDRSIFVEIVVPDWEDSFALFDGLNNRGLDLAKRDIIKNVVLARNEGPGEFIPLENRWRDIEKLMPENKFARFLRHFLLLHYENVSLKDTIRMFIRHCDGKNADQIVALLEQAGSAYQKLLDPSHETDLTVRRVLTRINTLAGERTYPIALAAKLASVTKANEVRLLESIEKLYFRRSAICQMDNKAIEGPIQEIAASITKDGNQAIDGAIAALNDLNPTDEEFVAQFRLRRDMDAAVSRYLLMKINNHVAGGHPIETTTLEHIMPQDPSKWNLSDEEAEKFDLYVNRIGNLTILTASDNSAIKNEPFVDKQNFYRNENLVINQSVLAATKWDSTEIEKRQDELAGHIVAIWPRD
jgi:hypothetical protein